MNAFEKEKQAFSSLQSLLQSPSFQEPAGADAGFPDFGFTIQLQDDRIIDTHIEYKVDASAQMGSMRDWIFDGEKFYTNSADQDSKLELLEIMNSSEETISNGKRLLHDLKEYACANVEVLCRSSLNHIKDKDKRYQALSSFSYNTDNFQLAKIEDDSLGDRILEHYSKKFKENQRSEADLHALFMMMGNDIWALEGEHEFACPSFGVNGFPILEGLTAKLEVRIQPRGLRSGKSPSIDVMASYRLKGKPKNGLRIL